MEAGDKQWFEDLFKHQQKQFDQRFDQVDSRMDQLDRRMDGLDEKIERVETTLLTEFHKWASPTEMRIRSHAAVLRALDMEVETLQERVKKLEENDAA